MSGTLYGEAVGAYLRRAGFILEMLSRDEENWKGKPSHIIYALNCHVGDLSNTMSKAKAAIASNPGRSGDFEWKGFVNVNLSTDLKGQFDVWEIQDDEVWEGLSHYVGSGYKVTFSHSSENHRFTCTFIGQPDCGANSGYGVSAFASTAYDALRVALFKVSVALPDVWSERVVNPSDEIG